MLIVAKIKPFPTIIRFEGVRVQFVPGNNVIDDPETSKKIQKSPVFKEMVECGDFRVVHDLDQKDQKLSVSEMKSVIDDTHAVDELERIIQNDTRETVKKYAADRITKVRSGNPEGK